MIVDDSNLSSFKSGANYTYYGGFYKRFPATISVPRSGFWNVTIDLGGGSASIKYNLSIIKV